MEIRTASEDGERAEVRALYLIQGRIHKYILSQVTHDLKDINSKHLSSEQVLGELFSELSRETFAFIYHGIPKKHLGELLAMDGPQLYNLFFGPQDVFTYLKSRKWPGNILGSVRVSVERVMEAGRGKSDRPEPLHA